MLCFKTLHAMFNFSEMYFLFSKQCICFQHLQTAISISTCVFRARDVAARRFPLLNKWIENMNGSTVSMPTHAGHMLAHGEHMKGGWRTHGGRVAGTWKTHDRQLREHEENIWRQINGTFTNIKGTWRDIQGDDGNLNEDQGTWRDMNAHRQLREIAWSE